MWFRVLRPFKFQPQRGKPVMTEAGQLLDVINRHVAAELLGRGLIVNRNLSHKTPNLGTMALAPGRRRVLLWMPMSSHYSGGRVHLTQCAWALAKLGNDVIVAGDRQPPWWGDYPPLPNLRLTLEDPTGIPDFDLVIVDGKNPVARRGEIYAQTHNVPLVAWNFETPNWFGQFCPDLVEHIQYHDDYKDLFRSCALAIANSKESKRWLREWIDSPTPPIEVLHPGVNTYAHAGGRVPIEASTRGYVLISGRADPYKNNQVSVDAVCSYDKDCDLVVIGSLGGQWPGDSRKHKLVHLQGVDDRTKFALMRQAALVLAPSSFEGFGMVPGEALSVGTPCVVYDLPVLRQEYGDLLEYVPRGDSQAFAQRVHQLLDVTPEVSPATQKQVIDFIGMKAMVDAVEHLPYHYSKRPRITALMNAYSCGETVAFALEAIYPWMHEIVITYGREEVWPWPADNTLEVLRNFPDPDKKIRIIVSEVWPGATGEASRIAMRRAGMKYVTGNYLLILDADEIWTGFEHYYDALETGMIEGGCPLAVTFWHTEKHHVLSSTLERWGVRSRFTEYGAVWPHVRVVPWRSSYRWKKHIVPVDCEGAYLWPPEKNLNTVEALGYTCVLYHLGQALAPDKMELKKKYYTERDAQRPTEVAWLNWNGECGEMGDGWVEEVTWELPEIVTRALKSIQGVSA